MKSPKGKSLVRRLFWSVIALLFVALTVLAFLPKPVPVDMATAERGTLLVTVDEDGVTRLRERFEISTPLDGRLRRIELDPGDPVVAGKTLLATLEPSDPSLLDARSRAQAEARVKAADADQERSKASLDQARARLDFAARELSRQRDLVEQRATSTQDLEQAVYDNRLAEEEVRSAEMAVRISEFESEQARAALIHTRLGNEGLENPENWQFEIVSPIDGRVLKVIQESSAVVTAGTRLLEIGDPEDLEIQIDVLSRDAVRIQPGDRVILEHWGGPNPLEGRVRVVEPSAFTKISALGVEEQRVYVIADFDKPEDQASQLGDGYRVEARIVIWEGTDVLHIPAGALFREGENWAVYVDINGEAQLRTLETGHNNGLEVEVLSGLSAGDSVILHPSDRIQDGVGVVAR